MASSVLDVLNHIMNSSCTLWRPAMSRPCVDVVFFPAQTIFTVLIAHRVSAAARTQRRCIDLIEVNRNTKSVFLPTVLMFAIRRPSHTCNVVYFAPPTHPRLPSKPGPSARIALRLVRHISKPVPSSDAPPRHRLADISCSESQYGCAEGQIMPAPAALWARVTVLPTACGQPRVWGSRRS